MEKLIQMKRKEKDILALNKKAGQSPSEDHTAEEKKEVATIAHHVGGQEVTIGIHIVEVETIVEIEAGQDPLMTEVPGDDMTGVLPMRGGHIPGEDQGLGDHLVQGKDLLKIGMREIREGRRNI